MEIKKFILQIIKKDLVSLFRPLLEFLGAYLFALATFVILCYIFLWVVTLGGYMVVFQDHDTIDWIPRQLEVALAILPYIAVPTIWILSIAVRVKNSN
jgi:hypothetical protein